MGKSCSHVGEIKITSAKRYVCEECEAMGDAWVHLRLCLECGHVGCCDSSKNKHATRHFLMTEHPLMRSVEPGESWVWCFVDQLVPGEIRHGKFVEEAE